MINARDSDLKWDGLGRGIPSLVESEISLKVFLLLFFLLFLSVVLHGDVKSRSKLDNQTFKIHGSSVIGGICWK